MITLTPSEIGNYFRIRAPKLRQSGKEWRGPCPVHNGANNSFAVNPETGESFCHSKCNCGWNVFALEQALSGIDAKTATKQVLGLVRPTTQANGRSNGKRAPRIVKAYSYAGTDGDLLFEVVRYEPKDFKQRRPDGKGGYIWNLKGIEPVLYHLPRLKDAETVFVAEGEQDVETIEALGLTATCNPMGAGKWRNSYTAFLKGKHVVILEDNDEAGKSHALDVQKRNSGTAASVCVISFPELGAKGDVTDWVSAGGTRAQLLQRVEAARSKINEPEPAARIDQAAKHFSVDAKGVYYKGDWICPKLEVIGRTRDFTGQGCGKLLEFGDWEGRERHVILPLSTLIGDGKEAIERLVDCGFKPNSSTASIKLVKQYLYESDQAKFIRSVQQTGWHAGTFVFPELSIGPPAAEPVLLYAEGPLKHKYHTAGTLSDWIQHIGQYCHGNSRALFAVSCAFASALLDVVKADNCGFHLRGVSSRGKTTVEYMAGSVWGGDPTGSRGFLETWRKTSNGMEASAAMHNDALLCLDEIGEVNEREIGEIVYSLGNGSGKGRMSRNITTRATPQFRLLFLSTGEQTLAQIMQKAGRDTRGGQEVRLVDIDADAGAGLGIWEKTYGREPGAFSKELELASKTYYGTPIRVFLKFVAENRNAVEKGARRYRDDFFQKRIKRTDAGEVNRVASIFGLIAAAGEIATTQRITGWKTNDALWAVDSCFRSWVDVRGGTGARDIETGVRAVRTFIQIHDARFRSIKEASSSGDVIGERRPVINQAGWREDTPKLFYIIPQVFETEILAGFDHRAIAKELIARDCLVPGEGKNLARKKRIPGLTVAPRFYTIRENIFSDG